ncbi:MAG: dinitrogenase iron-molybdenum cofactor biosynthesis protein [Deltaproteobacteria bacterium]|nr:dinitrogenase iron-molybdenum cofactor biosynthesis protein [Deltaproteobacteria bacterium]
MSRKILIPLFGNEVAPRFDLATDVMLVLVTSKPDKPACWESRIVVLPGPSADELCRLILNEDVQTVVCAGIEDEYFQFLTWKGVTVVDEVMGPVDRVVTALANDALDRGTDFYGPSNVL